MNIDDVKKARAQAEQANATDSMIESLIGKMREVPRDSYPPGTVIRWRARDYTYAALKAVGRWFTTAGDSNPFVGRVLSLDELHEVLQRPEVTKVDICIDDWTEIL